MKVIGIGMERELIMMPKADRDKQARQFLKEVYGHNCPGWITLFLLPSGETQWFQVQEHEAIIKAAQAAADRGQNVYINCCPQRSKLPAGRGGAESVIALPGCWADIDIRGEAHQGENYPESMQEVMEWLGSMEPKPSLLVSSGYGIHAWWLLDEIWILEPEERILAAQLVQRFMRWLQSNARQSHGWSLDAVGDLARVLRIPGSLNFKNPEHPQEVKLLHFDGEGVRYSREALEGYCSSKPSSEESSLLDLNRMQNITTNLVSRRATEFSLHGAPIGSQRREALAAARSYLANGKSVDQVIELVWNGLKASPQNPKDPWTREQAERIVRDIAERSPSTPLQIQNQGQSVGGRISMTDVGNARRWVQRWTGRFCYVPDQAGWMWYDGRRWTTEGAIEHAMQAAQDTVLDMLEECSLSLQQAAAEIQQVRMKAAEAQQQGAEVELPVQLLEELRALELRTRREYAWAMSSLTRSRLDSMLYLAHSDQNMLARMSDFNTNPWLFNCANGTIDLRTGELRPQHPGDYIDKMSPVIYNPDARSKVWEDYLKWVTQGDEEFEAYLRRAAGHLLVGGAAEKERVVFFLLGPSSTGKTTFVEALTAAMGDYARTADFDTFISRNRTQTGAPRPDLARLVGARMVAACETDAEGSLAENIIKRLTGGDTITVRFLYREEFEYRPEYSIVLAANKAPKINDLDQAIWNRLRKLPFENIIPSNRKDPTIKQRLQDPEEAGAAVLAWAVRGCLEWQQQGLGTCSRVEQGTAELRGEQDPLKDFFEECCEFAEGLETERTVLREAYLDWCHRTGQRRLMPNREWGDRLRRQSCFQTRHRNKDGTQSWVWSGVKLIKNQQLSLELEEAEDGESILDLTRRT